LCAVHTMNCCYECCRGIIDPFVGVCGQTSKQASVLGVRCVVAVQGFGGGVHVRQQISHQVPHLKYRQPVAVVAV
jgi:hypothetical protein